MKSEMSKYEHATAKEVMAPGNQHVQHTCVTVSVDKFINN
jgi:metal-responsive CopG/Arc/MetJ family transcriptional regulator